MCFTIGVADGIFKSAFSKALMKWCYKTVTDPKVNNLKSTVSILNKGYQDLKDYETGCYGKLTAICNT